MEEDEVVLMVTDTMLLEVDVKDSGFPADVMDVEELPKLLFVESERDDGEFVDPQLRLVDPGVDSEEIMPELDVE